MKRKINDMKLRLPAKSVNEAVARSVISAFCAELDPSVEELGDLRCAVSEAVTNCIVHAYPDAIGQIILRAGIVGRELHITVRDRGVGIADVAKACEPMFTTGNDERSGMGFTIMQTFMHDLKVTSQPGKGTTVHMKRIVGRRGGRA